MNFRNTWVKTQIHEDNIEKLQVKDKGLSIIISIGIPIVIIVGVILSGHESSCNGCLF